MSVRRIPKNYRNVTGIAAHNKAEGKAAFESTLERDFINLLEFDDNVKCFEVQPIRIEWLDPQDKPRHYTPDVLVYFKKHQRPTLYEVKYRSDLKENWPTLKPKFKVAHSYAKHANWQFKIITDKEIRTPFLDSVNFLLPYLRRGPQDEAHMTLLDNALKNLQRSTPKELISTIYKDDWNQARLLSTFWYLVASEQIGIDLNHKLTMSSKIWSK